MICEECGKEFTEPVEEFYCSEECARLNKMITDGFGNYWQKYCHCGAELQVMRPGKVQCPECG